MATHPKICVVMYAGSRGRQTQKYPLSAGGILAETGGFEPPVRFNPNPSLAVKSVRPLRHVSSCPPRRACPFIVQGAPAAREIEGSEEPLGRAAVSGVVRGVGSAEVTGNRHALVVRGCGGRRVGRGRLLRGLLRRFLLPQLDDLVLLERLGDEVPRLHDRQDPVGIGRV